MDLSMKKGKYNKLQMFNFLFKEVKQIFNFWNGFYPDISDFKN